MTAFCSVHHSFFCPCAAPWLYGDEERIAYESGEPTAADVPDEKEADENEDEQLELLQVAEARR